MRPCWKRGSGCTPTWRRIYGFWAGSMRYKRRCASSKPKNWRWSASKIYFYREMVIPVQSRHAPAQQQKKTTDETEAATARRAGHSGDRAEDLQASAASDPGRTQGRYGLWFARAGIAGGLGNSGADDKAVASAAARSRFHTTDDLQAVATDHPCDQASFRNELRRSGSGTGRVREGVEAEEAALMLPRNCHMRHCPYSQLIWAKKAAIVL